MNTEKEIVQQNVKEANLNQPVTPNARMPFLRPVNVISQIYKWNPTGFRIVLNLPIISDDAYPLFYLRAYPYIPNLNEDVVHYGWTEGAALFNYFRPLVHPVFLDEAGNASYSLQNSPVQFVQYGLSPLISILSLGNRRWRGDLEYRFRMASNFGNQGILSASPVYGVKQPLQYSDFMNNALPLQMSDTGYLPNFANSYTYNDASMFRHLEVRLPWQKPYEWEDHFANMNHILHQVANNSAKSSTPDQVALGMDAAPTVFDFIAFYLRGNLPATSTTNSIIIEVDIRAGENFEFSGECVYPSPLPSYLFNHLRTTTLAPSGRKPVLPGHLVVPDPKLRAQNLGELTQV